MDALMFTSLYGAFLSVYLVDRDRRGSEGRHTEKGFLQMSATA